MAHTVQNAIPDRKANVGEVVHKMINKLTIWGKEQSSTATCVDLVLNLNLNFTYQSYIYRLLLRGCAGRVHLIEIYILEQV
jgi:hypothetical protein